MSSNASNAQAKSLIRSSTALLVQEYLAKGGQVTVVPRGRRSSK
jgi:hypothetical protein